MSASRRDYLDDPSGPRANRIVPAVSALVVDEGGRILLHRRADSAEWALPGGAVEVGESVAEAVLREVREETGLDVAIRRLVGVYSNPGHVIAYSDGEVRQEFSVCFECSVEGGELRPSSESVELRFVSDDQLTSISVPPWIHRRIDDHLARHSGPVIA